MPNLILMYQSKCFYCKDREIVKSALVYTVAWSQSSWKFSIRDQRLQITVNKMSPVELYLHAGVYSPLFSYTDFHSIKEEFLCKCKIFHIEFSFCAYMNLFTPLKNSLIGFLFQNNKTKIVVSTYCMLILDRRSYMRTHIHVK